VSKGARKKRRGRGQQVHGQGARTGAAPRQVRKGTGTGKGMSEQGRAQEALRQRQGRETQEQRTGRD